MRTILIPTDFTVNSLLPVKKILQVNGSDEVRILLFHCVHAPDSITDLLLFSKPREIRRLSGTEFADACEIIRHRFAPALNNLVIDLFMGNTHSAFENFVEGWQADAICLAKQMTYAKPSPQSADPMAFIKKSSIPVLEMDIELSASPLTQNRLAALFLETEKNTTDHVVER